MAFADIVKHAAADKGVTQIKTFSKGISLFAHNFAPDASTQFAGVAVPVYNLTAKNITTSTNSWYNLDEIGGTVVTLDKRVVAGLTLADTEVGVANKAGWGESSFSRAQIVSDATVSIVKAIEQQIAADLYGKFDTAVAKTQITLSDDFGAMVAEAAEKLNPAETVLVLNPTQFYKLYSELPQNIIYQQTDPIQDGVLRNVYGLKAVVMAPALPSGVEGAFVADGVFGVVNRLNVPVIDGYFDTFELKTDDGFSIGFRAYEDLRDGAMKFGGDCLYGSKFLQLDSDGTTEGFLPIVAG